MQTFDGWQLMSELILAGIKSATEFHYWKKSEAHLHSAVFFHLFLFNHMQIYNFLFPWEEAADT